LKTRWISLPTLDLLPRRQLWHPHPQFRDLGFRIASSDREGIPLPTQSREVWHSAAYGVKEPAIQLCFQQPGNYFRTVIHPEEMA
jgi:hypothetical protein